MPEEDKKQEHQHNAYEIKTVLAWNAMSRPYKKRTKNFFTSALLIALFIEIILFLFSQYMLMLVVISLVFLAFALAIVPPNEIHYKVTTEGIRIDDHFYLWQELYDFYFKKHFGFDVVHIRTHYFVPPEINLMLGDITLDHMRNVLAQFLPYREYVQPTFMEKSGDWLSKNFPLEQPAAEKKS